MRSTEELIRMTEWMNRKFYLATGCQVIAMVAVIVGIIPWWFNKFLLGSVFFGIATIFLAFAYQVGNEGDKIRNQINKEYGKPTEKITFE